MSLAQRMRRLAWRWFDFRAIVSLLMTCALALANVGYPAWEPATSKSGEPFPCQFSKCGCRTAAQCRTSCCCHSKQQKIAWAIERGINPDQVAVLSAAEKLQYSRKTERLRPAKLCCSVAKTSTKNCCSTAQAKPNCCTEHELGGRLTFVLAIAAQKCTGTGVEWIQAGFVAAPPKPVTLVITVPQIPLTDAINLEYLPPTSGQLLRPA